MLDFGKFCRMAKEFAEHVDFLSVYIEEAHPIEGFAFNTQKFQLNQHNNLEDRISAAKGLMEFTEGGVPFPVVVDAMNDDATWNYGARPERLVAVKDGRVVFLGTSGPYNYDVTAAEEWVKKYVGK